MTRITLLSLLFATLPLGCGPEFIDGSSPARRSVRADSTSLTTGGEGGSSSSTQNAGGSGGIDQESGGASVSGSTTTESSAGDAGSTVTLESEPNYPQAKANPIGATVLGAIDPAGDADAFVFAWSGGDLTVASHDPSDAGCSFAATLTLYDSTNYAIAQAAGDCPTINPSLYPKVAHLDAGSYVLVISELTNSKTIDAYQIDVTH